MPPKNPISGRVLSESVIEVHGIPHRQVIYEGGRIYLEPLAKPQAALQGSLAARQARREYGRLRREKGG